MDGLMPMSRADIIQNLRESDVSEEMVLQIMRLYDEEQLKEAVPVLKRHKQTLLERLHQSQDKVDRLDFLVYRLEKCEKKQEE